MQKAGWKLAAEKAVDEIYSTIFFERDSWTLFKTIGNVSVYTKSIRGSSMLYYLTFDIDIPASEAKRELYDDVSNLPSWNPTISKSERVETLSETSDIIYQVSANNKMAAERDMVLARKCASRDHCIIISSVSVLHPQKSENTQYKRITSGPAGWILQPNPTKANTTIAHLLLNMDLKLWLPQITLKKYVSGSLFELASSFQNRAKAIYSSI